MAGALGGDGRLGLVEGPAGIGKTRLLAAVRALAADAGMRCLTARGGELERAFPFGVVRQLYEPALASAPPAERASSSPGRPASSSTSSPAAASRRPPTRPGRSRSTTGSTG